MDQNEWAGSLSLSIGRRRLSNESDALTGHPFVSLGRQRSQWHEERNDVIAEEDVDVFSPAMAVDITANGTIDKKKPSKMVRFDEINTHTHTPTHRGLG